MAVDRIERPGDETYNVDWGSPYWDLSWVEWNIEYPPTEVWRSDTAWSKKNPKDYIAGMKVIDQINGPNSATIQFSRMDAEFADNPFFNEDNETQIKIIMGYYYTSGIPGYHKVIFNGVLRQTNWSYGDGGVACTCTYIERAWDRFDQIQGELGDLFKDGEKLSYSDAVKRIAEEVTMDFISFVVDDDYRPAEWFYDTKHTITLAKHKSINGFFQSIMQYSHTKGRTGGLSIAIKDNVIYIGRDDIENDVAKLFAYGGSEQAIAMGWIPTGLDASEFLPDKEHGKPSGGYGDLRRLYKDIFDDFKSISVGYNAKNARSNTATAAIYQGGGHPIVQRLHEVTKAELDKENAKIAKKTKKLQRKENKKPKKKRKIVTFNQRRPSVEVNPTDDDKKNKKIYDKSFSGTYVDKSVRGRGYDAGEVTVPTKKEMEKKVADDLWDAMPNDKKADFFRTRPAKTMKQAWEFAKMAREYQQRSDLTVSVLGCKGDPFFTPPLAFGVVGLKKKHNGRFATVSVIHHMRGEGYLMDILGIGYAPVASDYKYIPPKKKVKPYRGSYLLHIIDLPGQETWQQLEGKLPDEPLWKWMKRTNRGILVHTRVRVKDYADISRATDRYNKLRKEKKKTGTRQYDYNVLKKGKNARVNQYLDNATETSFHTWPPSKIWDIGI